MRRISTAASLIAARCMQPDGFFVPGAFMENERRSWAHVASPTLLARDDAIWLWPGIPLAAKAGDSIQPLRRDWVNFWISQFHGFEANIGLVHKALDRAAQSLTVGSEPTAQAVLAEAGLNRLSPEGAVLMRAVAKRFAIAPLDIEVGTKSLPWGGSIGAQAYLFDDFAGAVSALQKVDDPKHPQWPAGTPDGKGGQFRPKDSTAVSGDSAPPQSEEPSPGIGHNGGPPLEDDLPDIPEIMPSSVKVRNAIIKSVAQWALRRGIAMLIPGVGEALLILQAAQWIAEDLPYINAYLQKPKSLQDLQDDASDPEDGYQIHHIVEQTAARKAGFPEPQIEAPTNPRSDFDVEALGNQRLVW